MEKDQPHGSSLNRWSSFTALASLGRDSVTYN